MTSFPDLAFETFRYHLEALDYIVKGDSEKMLSGMYKNLAVITERMCKEQGEQKEYFTVKVLDIVKHVPVDEIMFFETGARTHRIELHAKNDPLFGFAATASIISRGCLLHRAICIS